MLNDRGMDLTAADLIKSYLIGELNFQLKNDTDLLKINEKRFMSDWHTMEEIIKNSDINLSELFTMYEYYSLANNPRKSLTEELQELFKNKDPNKVISEIKDFARVYDKKAADSDSKIIYSLRYIRWSMYWKTIVLTAFIEKYKFIDELFFELRRFYYLYWIAGKTLSQVKQISFNTIKAIKDSKDIDYIKEIFSNKIEKEKIISLVKENLKSKEVDEEV